MAPSLQSVKSCSRARADVLSSPSLPRQEYFNDLFCGGFAEDEQDDLGRAAAGEPALVDQRQQSWTQSGEREVELHIEDPNISRAAFECVRWQSCRQKPAR